jgi:hypothetical protein
MVPERPGRDVPSGPLALQDRRSPLFDTARCTAHLEAAFRRMHERAVR